MSRNKLGNLNDLLMHTIQNIVDPETDTEGKILNEMTVEKASAVAKVAQVMVNNAKVQVDAFKLVQKGVARASDLPEILAGENHKQIAEKEK